MAAAFRVGQTSYLRHVAPSCWFMGAIGTVMRAGWGESCPALDRTSGVPNSKGTPSAIEEREHSFAVWVGAYLSCGNANSATLTH